METKPEWLTTVYSRDPNSPSSVRVCSSAELRELAIVHNISGTINDNTGDTVYEFTPEDPEGHNENMPSGWGQLRLIDKPDGGYCPTIDFCVGSEGARKSALYTWIQNSLHTGNE